MTQHVCPRCLPRMRMLTRVRAPGGYRLRCPIHGVLDPGEPVVLPGNLACPNRAERRAAA